MAIHSFVPWTMAIGHPHHHLPGDHYTYCNTIGTHWPGNSNNNNLMIRENPYGWMAIQKVVIGR